MTPERWKQVREIFDAAVDREGDARSSFVDSACAGDADLRHEVQSLLNAYQPDHDFLEASPVAGVAVVRAPDFMEGRRIGPYGLVRKIGSGGMGSVYAAVRVDNAYKNLVAVKVVRQGMASDDVLRRFWNERQVLATLNHPNIARLLDGGTTSTGEPYLVMEYVEGVGLEAYCVSHRLSIAERIALFRHVCSAVQYAHQNLVVHRDLKPSNILVTPDGTPKLLDFGIAKILRAEYASGMDLTRTEFRPMTPEYASPEQIRGEPITTSTDVYSLGILLYRLLTGKHPYVAPSQSATDIERMILETDPERPSVTIRHGNLSAEAFREPSVERLSKRLQGDLDVIALTALRKEPQRRYASVEQLADDLARHLDGLPVRAHADTLLYRARKFALRNRRPLIATGIAAAVLLASTIVSLRSAVIARAERQRAETRFNQVRQLATFLLFDFDSAIEAGPTPARKAVITKGVEYLNQLSADSGDDPSLEKELIRGYLKIGKVQGNLFSSNLGDQQGARTNYLTALRLAEALNTGHPADVDAKVLLATVHMNLADLASLTGMHSDAIAEYKKAENVFASLAAANRDAQQGLMDVCWALGFAHSQIEQLYPALDYYDRFLKLAQDRLAADPGNAKLRRSVAFGQLRTGEVLVRTGAKASGLERMQTALEMYEKAAAEDPKNPKANSDVASTRLLLGDTQDESGNKSESAAEYRKALAIYEDLLASDPNNKQYERNRLLSLGRLAGALASEGPSPEGRAATTRVLQMLKPLAERADPSPYDLQLYCWTLLTTPYKDLQNKELAQQVAERLVSVSKSADPTMLDMLAQAQYANGSRERAVETARRALALIPPDSTSALRRQIEANLLKFQAVAAPK